MMAKARDAINGAASKGRNAATSQINEAPQKKEPSRPKQEENVSSGTVVNQPTNEPNNNDLTVNNLSDTKESNNNDLKVDESSNNQTVDNMHLSLPGENKDLLKELENAKKEAARLKRLYDDPDIDPHDDDDKFDIQQGDFIEFLMKDVVLSSAAWVGKKVSGFVGYYSYKSASKIYHGVKDHVITPSWDAICDGASDLKKDFDKFCEHVGEHQIKDTLDGKDDTQKQAKEIIKKHNEFIDIYKNNGKTNGKFSEDVFNRFAEEIYSGHVNNSIINGTLVWKDKETQTIIPLDSIQMQHLKTRVDTFKDKYKDNPEFLNQNKPKMLDIINKLAQQITYEDANRQIFISSMTSAYCLDVLAKTGKAPSEEEVSVIQRRMNFTYALESKKILNGKSMVSNPKDLVNLADKANQSSFDAIKDGKYQEIYQRTGNENNKYQTNPQLTNIISPSAANAEILSKMPIENAVKELEKISGYAEEELKTVNSEIKAQETIQHSHEEHKQKMFERIKQITGKEYMGPLKPQTNKITKDTQFKYIPTDKSRN